MFMTHYWLCSPPLHPSRIGDLCMNTNTIRSILEHIHPLRTVYCFFQSCEVQKSHKSYWYTLMVSHWDTLCLFPVSYKVVLKGRVGKKKLLKAFLGSELERKRSVYSVNCSLSLLEAISSKTKIANCGCIVGNGDARSHWGRVNYRKKYAISVGAASNLALLYFSQTV